MPATVVRGAVATSTTFFYQADGITPLIIDGGVQFSIFTPNNLLLETNIAIQSTTNPAQYTANFTIPQSAPLTEPDTFYRILWVANVSQPSTLVVNNNEYFDVIDDTAGYETIETSIVAVEHQPFYVNLVLPVNTITTLSLRIVAPQGHTLLTYPGLLEPNSANTDSLPDVIPVLHGNSYVYAFQIDEEDAAKIPTPHGGFAQYFAVYNYTTANSMQKIEIIPVYIANMICITMMNDIRQFCDMLRNNDAIAELRISEFKLMHFALQGLRRLNATSPGNFGFDFDSLGRDSFGTFYFWAVKCAEYELMAALFIAEGMTSFDFQGMTVQLNSDRTQYISTAMQDLKNDIDTNLPRVKSQWARAGAGKQSSAFGATLGPATNWIARVNPVGLGVNGPLSSLPFLL